MAINRNYELLEVASRKKSMLGIGALIGSTLFASYFIVKNFEIVKKEDFYGK